MAKSLFIYFILFSYLDLLHKEEVWESVTWQMSHITSYMLEYHSITSHEWSHMMSVGE